MKVVRTDLSDLLFVRDEKFKNFKLYVSFAAPLGKENATYNALLSKVLAAGCKKYPDKREVSIALKKMYGTSMSFSSKKVGGALCVSLVLDAVNEKFAEEGLTDSIFEFAGEMLLNPLVSEGKFKENIVSREKKVLEADIAGLINDKRTYALARCLEITCGDDPYGCPPLGDAEICRAITAEQLYDYYKFIISECRPTIVVLGNFDEAKAKKCAKTLLSKFGGSKRQKTDILPYKADITRVTEKSDITQGKLVMAYATGELSGDDVYIESVMNAVFGGGVSSKLFNVVREKMSLCYYASSYVDKYKGLVLAQAGIDFDKYEKTVEAINMQLADVQKGNFTDTEFDNAVRGLVNTVDELSDDPDLLLGFYVNALSNDEIVTPEELREKYLSVNREQIIERARLMKEETVFFLCALEEEM